MRKERITIEHVKWPKCQCNGTYAETAGHRRKRLLRAGSRSEGSSPRNRSLRKMLEHWSRVFEEWGAGNWPTDRDAKAFHVEACAKSRAPTLPDVSKQHPAWSISQVIG